jgi:hypothetical protein
MNNRQERVIAAARNGASWVRDLENAPPRVTKAAERLQEALDEVREARREQLEAKNFRSAPRYSVTAAKTILVKKHLHPLATDGLELFAGLPGIEETLRIPRIKDAPDAHLTAAERVRQVAEDHEQEFIDERNYSENFLEQFDKAVEDLRAAARVDRGSARAKYTRATMDLKDEITRVRRAFDALDARMVEAYMKDRTALQLWRQMSRVRPKTGRPRKRKSQTVARHA